MAKLTKRLMKRYLGDPKRDGYHRSLRGLREGDSREFTLGLALIALAYLRASSPNRRLLYRKSVPTGSALVIHHKRHGDPKLEIRRG